MPFRVEIDPERRRALVEIDGTVTAAVVMEAMEELFGNPQWQPGYDGLWDCSGIQQLVMDPADLGALVALATSLAPRIGTGRGAFVLTRDLDSMMAALVVYRSRPSDRDRRVFRTREEAVAWLDGVDPHGGTAMGKAAV